MNVEQPLVSGKGYGGTRATKCYPIVAKQGVILVALIVYRTKCHARAYTSRRAQPIPLGDYANPEGYGIPLKHVQLVVKLEA